MLSEESDHLITAESKKLMQNSVKRVPNSREKEYYGMGLIIEKVAGEEVFGHGGGFPGQVTRTLVNPQKKLVVVVLSNSTEADSKSRAKGILTFLTKFLSITKKKKASINLKKFEGRFMNLWSVSDIVQIGGKLFAFDPGYFNLFEEFEELKYIDGQTLQVKKAARFGSDKELVNYKFRGGKVSSIKYAGYTMLPEDDYMRKIKKIKEIKL